MLWIDCKKRWNCERILSQKYFDRVRCDGDIKHMSNEKKQQLSKACDFENNLNLTSKDYRSLILHQVAYYNPILHGINTD